MKVNPLFTPYRLEKLTLRNRFVMSPMTRERAIMGIPGPQTVEYYRRRAASVGLIITEGVYISHQSAGISNEVPRMYGEEALAGWSNVIAAVHEQGGAIIPQLWHRGAARYANKPPYPDAPIVSPSGVGLTNQHIGDPLSLSEIDKIIQSYVDAALTAQSLGFDGIELHGAHGYLLDNFLWALTNKRSDQYGGSLSNRARFAADVVGAIRSAVGPDYPIIYRYSQWKISDYNAQIAQTPAELEEILHPIVHAGVSLFDVSARRYWRPAFADSRDNLAKWTHRITGTPVMAVGSVGVRRAFLSPEEDQTDMPTLQDLAQSVAQDDFQLVGVGRALVSDPQWVDKVQTEQFENIREYKKEHEEVLW